MDAEVIVVGAGIGGLVTATQLAVRGIKVLVLEKYLIPGGSAGYFVRNGYRFDVGASMIFGFGKQGTTNLLTRALQAVGQELETIPDEVQVHYHLPNGLAVEVPRDYDQFIDQLSSKFPHERVGIRKFYDQCWQVFHCLNSIELLSLEEWHYLLRVFGQNPLACLGLVRYLPQNVGAIARRYIRDPLLLKFIDMECYIWSVVPADKTPMINAGMVFSDRHYGGVNYPKGGVGQIGERLVAGLRHYGGEIYYSARVTKIIPSKEGVAVQLANGKRLYAKKVVSNATRWDTFERLLGDLPPRERRWQNNYQKSPSFVSLHLGVKACAIPAQTRCHHVLLEDWEAMEQSLGTVFVSIPTLLDPTLAPPERHIVHAFTPSWLAEWQGLSPSAYEHKKQTTARQVIARLRRLFPELENGLEHQEIGTPRTHRRFLGRVDGTYGPMPRRPLWGLLPMPLNRTAIPHVYCVGDSTFPGQGLNAVAFSGFACAHIVSADLGRL
jgi:prolycopene isomerase